MSPNCVEQTALRADITALREVCLRLLCRAEYKYLFGMRADAIFLERMIDELGQILLKTQGTLAGNEHDAQL